MKVVIISIFKHHLTYNIEYRTLMVILTNVWFYKTQYGVPCLYALKGILVNWTAEICDRHIRMQKELINLDYRTCRKLLVRFSYLYERRLSPRVFVVLRSYWDWLNIELHTYEYLPANGFVVQSRLYLWTHIEKQTRSHFT